MNETIVASYLIETPHSLEFAAEMIAGEQSSGTFVAVPGETEELKARSRAKICKVTPLEAADTPSLRGSRPPKSHDGQYHRAEITISFPIANVGANLPT